jgi:hypothetical protein
MTKTKRVSFWANEETKVPVKVTFQKNTGEKVTFWATEKVIEPVKVTFRARRQRP